MEETLFTQNMTAKDKVYHFVKEMKYARTSDVIRFGTQIYSNRALRNAQQLASDGFLIRLTDLEKAYLGYVGREDVWKTTDKVYS